MVLSLVNLCLLSIRDYIEKDQIQNVHELPSKWHQTILDFILMHGTILKKSCLHILTTPEFLRSFTNLSTLCGRVNDTEFLDRLSKTLGTFLNSDSSKNNRFQKSIDQNRLSSDQSKSRLVQLNLNLYAVGDNTQNRDNEKYQMKIDNFSKAVDLLTKCPNLKILNLRFISNQYVELYESNGSIVRFLPLSSSTSSSSWKPLDDGGFLNAITAYRSCLSILENLIDFSLICNDLNLRRLPPLLTSHQPLIGFKKLSSLHLEGGTCYFDAWFKFLQSISRTLQFLHVENVEFHWGRERNASVLPFRMPELLVFRGHANLSYCDSILIKNLRLSTKLQSISLTLSGLETDENLTNLAEIDCLDEIRLNFRHGLFAERGADHVVKKLVDLFGEKIISFLFNGSRTPIFGSACEILVGGCPNLVCLRLDTSITISGDDQIYLTPLFKNRRRAMKLRDLELHGRLASSVLSYLFDHCLNLESLSISDCPQLTDTHLHRWADRGGRPHTLKLINCTKISEDGLLSILINCGLRLTHFRYTTTEANKISERTLNTLAEYCRNIEWFCCPANVCNDSILAKIRKKSWKQPVKAILV